MSGISLGRSERIEMKCECTRERTRECVRIHPGTIVLLHLSQTDGQHPQTGHSLHPVADGAGWRRQVPVVRPRPHTRQTAPPGNTHVHLLHSATCWTSSVTRLLKYSELQLRFRLQTMRIDVILNQFVCVDAAGRSSTDASSSRTMDSTVLLHRNGPE